MRTLKHVATEMALHVLAYNYDESHRDHRHTSTDQGHQGLFILALGNNRPRASTWRITERFPWRLEPPKTKFLHGLGRN